MSLQHVFVWGFWYVVGVTYSQRQLIDTFFPDVGPDYIEDSVVCIVRITSPDDCFGNCSTQWLAFSLLYGCIYGRDVYATRSNFKLQLPASKINERQTDSCFWKSSLDRLQIHLGNALDQLSYVWRPTAVKSTSSFFFGGCSDRLTASKGSGGFCC